MVANDHRSRYETNYGSVLLKSTIQNSNERQDVYWLSFLTSGCGEDFDMQLSRMDSPEYAARGSVRCLTGAGFTIVRKLAAVTGGVEKRGLNFELARFFEHTRNFGFNVFQAGR
jgi:hypothetical protein